MSVDRLTGTFDVSEFVCEERTDAFGESEYSVDGETWCETETEAISQFRRSQPEDDMVIL